MCGDEPISAQPYLRYVEHEIGDAAASGAGRGDDTPLPALHNVSRLRTIRATR